MQALSMINTLDATFTVHFVTAMAREPMKKAKILAHDPYGVCVSHPSVDAAYIPFSSIACLVTEKKPKKTRKKKAT